MIIGFDGNSEVRFYGFNQLKAYAKSHPLHHLRLQCCELFSFPSFILSPSWQELNYLDLSYNKISIIPSYIDEIPQLQILVISHNALISLPPNIFNLPNLTSIWASHNRITRLPHTFFPSHRLQTLDLSNNNLTHITDQITSLTNLTTLNLKNNRIHSLPDSFTQLKSLKILNLSFNKLKKIPPLYNMTHLEMLDASHNNLSHTLDLHLNFKLNVLIVHYNWLTQAPILPPNFVEGIKMLQIIPNWIVNYPEPYRSLGYLTNWQIAKSAHKIQKWFHYQRLISYRYYQWQVSYPYNIWELIYYYLI